MKEILKTHDTFPKLLVRNAEVFGDRKVAMREKEFGIWQEFSWKEYHDHVKYFSLGLVSLGLQAGDKVAIIGDNRPEWVWGEVASQAAGAVPLSHAAPLLRLSLAALVQRTSLGSGTMIALICVDQVPPVLANSWVVQKIDGSDGSTEVAL